MRKRLVPGKEDSIPDGAFRLSRVYAEGWNAAKKVPLLGSCEFDPVGSAVPNPYATEPERSRWAEGFAKAMGNPGGNASVELCWKK